AAIADRARKRRNAVLAFALAAFLIFLAHVPATEPWLIVALAALAGGAWTGVVPIIDAFAIRQAKVRRFAFGPPRAFGSAAFIAGNLGCGALIGLYGGEIALYWTITGAGLAVLAAALLPEGRRAAAAAQSRSAAPIRDLLSEMSRNGLPLAFAASGLVQGAHGFYYAFSAIAWKAAGVPAGAVGALWATGVAAEIVFFAIVSRFSARLGPAALLLIGAGASVLRWSLLALDPPLVLLFPLQILHAFSFGATYLGFLRYAADHAPERYGATAQALNSALSGGLILAGATWASGHAYAAFGVAGFAAMAIPAGLGLGFAVALARRRPAAS
ncbi:MAG: MFS transporter, partial [Oceanicaulis sp.]